MANKKFEAVLQAVIEEDQHDHCWHIVNNAFPDMADKRDYLAWARALDPLPSPRKRIILTPQEFTKQVDSMDFHNTELVSQLRRSMGWYTEPKRPWFPVGFEEDVLYRLTPAPDRLRAQQDDTPPTSTSRPLLPDSILGINTTVQPREPALPAKCRQPGLSEASTVLVDSGSYNADAPGFVFFQVGVLEYAFADDEEGWPVDEDAVDDVADGVYWQETGFSLVARLSASGYADGIFAVYDMFPRHEYVEGRHQIKCDIWGIPPLSEVEHFSCAKVADRMSDLGPRRQWVWTEKIEHPVELVRTTPGVGGRALRVMVDGGMQSESANEVHEKTDIPFHSLSISEEKKICK